MEILSVLLNLNHSDVDLGANLSDFKAFASNFDPDVRIREFEFKKTKTLKFDFIFI